MRPLPVLLCTVSLAFPGAVAAGETAADGEALLERYFRDVQNLTARFAQSLVDDNDVVVEESAGTVQISRPGRFRWSYTEPYEQLLIADGLNVWSYDVDLAQATVKPQAEVLANTPALLLGGDGDALDDFEVVDTFTDRGTVWVSLRPRDDEAGFSRIELGFTDGTLGRMIFADNLEQTTLVALYDVAVNTEVDPAQFRFSPPEGVDLVGVPLVSDAGD